MTLGNVAAPARLWARPRRLLLVVLALACAALAWRVSRRAEPRRAELPAPPYVCVMPAAPEPPPPPRPGVEAWDGLERCLAAQPIGPGYPARVTLAQVRGWVAEGDPVWLSEGQWWFPLSGEGDEQMPSGYYLSVPACGGAIVN